MPCKDWEDETGRIEQIKQETQSQYTQSKTDDAHEQQSLKENAELLEKLEQEQKTIIEQQEGAEDSLVEKETARNELEKKVIELEERYTALMQGEAEAKARKQSLEQQIETNSERLQTIKARKSKAEEELNDFADGSKNAERINLLSSEINLLEDKLKVIKKSIAANESDRNKYEERISETRELVSAAESKKSKFDAEIAMLESFFEQESVDQFSPVLENVIADSGFEKALSRALGDTLLASLDDDAPVRWISRKNVKDMPALPAGIKPLLPHVKAPKELHLALSQIGLVENDVQGNEAVNALLPGQALVSEAGTYWRWDGYCVKAEASDRNALHLEQKNKLKELEEKTPQIESAVTQARNALEKILSAQAATDGKLKNLQEETRQIDNELTEKRAELSRLREEQVRYDSETTRLQDTVSTADEDIKTLEEVIQWDKDRLNAYARETSEQKTEDTEQVKQSLVEAREAHQAAIRAFDIYQQQQNSRKARMHAIADERVNLQNRVIRSRERIKQLEERKTTLSEKLEELKNQPKDFEIDKGKLLDKISTLEESRSGAAEKLAAAETELAETTRALKEAESNLGDARESRAGAQATMSALKEQHDAMDSQIREQFDVTPEKLPEHAAIDTDKDYGDLESLKEKKEKLVRERENIGAVNLRAEEEAQELEKEVATLLNERSDLVQAIEELRKGIATINKEARERLLSAFEHVNAHFSELFTRLFNGGNAHLALIDSDDPLGAGLEIYAEPPGKTLQSLSLLSGGEQTMASIALIFAMFLTNPSPICVLDEIDAPLDDANVDRVCDLLEEISERGETRFVIITHHRMTMARMDRLYGVTMAEKGISQLVSVDLQQSFDFLEAA